MKLLRFKQSAKIIEIPDIINDSLGFAFIGRFLSNADLLLRISS